MRKVRYDHKVEKIYLNFIPIFFSITLVFCGAILNVLVLATNDGRMPVYDSDWNLNTKTHFSFNDFSEVNNPGFSDRFNLFDKVYFSLGDVLLYFGLISLLFFNVKYLFLYRKYGKKKRKM
jgi:hypothetical protein